MIIAADPGTGISSPTGFSVFNPVTLEILYAANIGTKRKLLQHRLKEISDIFQNTILDIDGHYSQTHDVLFCIEQFVMRGKGGETLQRVIGSLIGRLPYGFNLVHVQNTTVKLMVAGHGHAEKHEVAKGLEKHFSSNKSSEALIKSLTDKNEYDILDSLAIGVTGWKTFRGQISPKTLRKRKKPKKEKDSPPTIR